MKDSEERFMVGHFKPAYQRFVRHMTKWNAMYVRSLGLAVQSMRPSIENKCTDSMQIDSGEKGRIRSPKLLLILAVVVSTVTDK